MFYKFTHFELTRTVMSVLPVTKFSWELPLFQFKYGPNNICPIKEFWSEKHFIDAAPTPESEYNRMLEQYGADDNGIPFVVMVYGQQFDIGRTLTPRMRECVSINEPAVMEIEIESRQVHKDRPQITEELLTIKAAAEKSGDQKLLAAAHELFKKSGIDWIFPETNELAEQAPDTALIDNPADVELPISLDPKNQGLTGVTKTAVINAMVAMGFDPDEQSKREEVFNDCDELMKVELGETFGQVPEMDGENMISRYARLRPFIAAKRAAVAA